MRILLLLVALVCIWHSSPTEAASPPDAGQLLQQQHPPAQLPQRFPDPAEQPAKKSEIDSDVKINVTGFRFSGFAEIITEEELQTLVRPALGMTLGLAELKKLTAEITDYLRSKGYLLSRAYLPKQEIVDGVVHIAIIAGQVQDVPDLRISEQSRIKPQILAEMASAGAPSGKALQQPQLERSLLLMNDLPGISARSILESGETPGSTRITIEAQEGPLLSGAVSVNNFGNRYTGALQAVGRGSANDISGYGDQLSLTATRARGLKKAIASYSLPLGVAGLKVQTSYSGLAYELGKDMTILDGEGTAQSLNISLSNPVLRSRRLSLWQMLQYEARALDDRMGGARIKKRFLDILTLGISINAYDRFGGGGLTNFNTALNIGTIDLRFAADAVTDAATARSEGHYSKLAFSLSRLQRLNQEFSFFGFFSGQLACKNLDSSEKYILGGPAGLRAYPVGEATGDEGFSFSTELRYDLPDKFVSSNLQLVAFLDAGQIRQHDTPWTNSISSATGKNSYWLSGAGVGINLDRPGKYGIHTSYATPLGSNPGRSTSGMDADNRDSNHRAWVQSVFWF